MASQEYYSTITFIVRDEYLKPVKGATVKVMDTWEINVYESGISDASGQVKIVMPYSPSMYLAHAEFGSQKSYSVFVDFKTDATVYLDLLPVEQPKTPKPTTPTMPTTKTPVKTTTSTTTQILFIFALIVVVAVILWLSG